MFQQKILFAVVLQIAVTCLLGLEKPAVGLAKQGELADLKQAYEESIATGRDMVTKCIELRIRFFHNGYEESGEWGEKWDEATKELAAHSKKIRKAAIDYFLANEEPDPELRKVIGLSIKSMLQDKEFQLAHKVLVRFEKIAPKDLSIRAGHQVHAETRGPDCHRNGRKPARQGLAFFVL